MDPVRLNKRLSTRHAQSDSKRDASADTTGVPPLPSSLVVRGACWCDSENAEVFRDAAEGAEEHRLEYDELHKKYLERFEAKLEAFIVKEGASPAEFIADCKSSLEDEFCALFEEDVNKEFVEMILATIEYPSFHKIMVGAARKRLEPKHK